MNLKELKEQAKVYLARLVAVEEKTEDHEKRLKALEVILMSKPEEDLKLEISPTKFKGLDQ